MAHPKLDNAVIMEIKSARAEGLSLGQIEEQMKAIREAGSVSTPMPGHASIAIYVREHDEHPADPDEM